MEPIVKHLGDDASSEVADALFGFLNNNDLIHIDTLYEEEKSQLFPLPSSPERSLSNMIFEQAPPLSDPLITPFVFPQTNYHNVGSRSSMMDENCYGCSINNAASAQSVAARERRKRISEKIRQLGRLVPGGTKMSTAEMLQAAFKYVKFLQAQYDVLLRLKQECLESSCKECLEALLASASVQERLSAEGMCVVPQQMLAADIALPPDQSNS